MENAGELGPAGADPVRREIGGRRLTPQRGAVLELLTRLGRPAAIAEVAQVLGVHVNTAREHLDGLVDAGLAVRQRAQPSGRGRPGFRYAAAQGAVAADPQIHEYVGLASALARHIARTSADPVTAAVDAGHAWGTEVAARHREPADTAMGARRRVVRLLDDLGFDPVPDAAVDAVRLRRCPMLEAARLQPTVICGVHLGLVRGYVEAFAADPSGIELAPFAEPGACVLHFAPERAR